MRATTTLVLLIVSAALLTLLLRNGAQLSPGDPNGRAHESTSVAPMAAASSESVDLDRKRVSARTILRIVDEHDQPVPAAGAYLVERQLRRVPANALIATADASGHISLPDAASNDAEAQLTICADGFASEHLGRIGSLRDADIVRLRQVARVCVRLLEGTRPIADAAVALSQRFLPDDSVFADEQSAASMPGTVGSISAGITQGDGAVWLPLPGTGPCFIRVHKKGFIAIDGTPTRHSSPGDGLVIELQLRRLYGCTCQVRGDTLLSYSYRMPPQLQTPATNIAYLHHLQQQSRKDAEQILLLVGSLREPIYPGAREDEDIMMEIECWTSTRGLVSLPVGMKWMGLTPETQVLNVAGERECPHGELAVRFVDTERKPLAIGAMPLEVLELEGDRVLRGVSVQRCTGRLPAGTYAVGHRFDDVLRECTEGTQQRIELLPDGRATHEVVLKFLPRELALHLRGSDGLAVHGARCLFEREQGCDQPGPRRVVRIHPDLRTTSFWLPPGSWQLTVSPFDGSERLVREFVIAPELTTQSAIILE